MVPRKSVIFLCLALCGCTTSNVITSDDGGCRLSLVRHKDAQERTVSDLVAMGDYQRAEKFARAYVDGGKNPVLVRKTLKGRGASERTFSEDIPPAPPCDVAMRRLDLCSVLLLEGKKDDAHEELLKAESEIEQQFDPDSQALKLTHGESEKFFKGDGYERATMYAFLALSFLDRGQYDEAIKRVKRGIAADTDAEKGEYRADYALLPYIGYVAASKAGREQEAADFDETVHSLSGFRPSKAEVPAALLIVWTGCGTSRELGGEFDEIRYIRKGSICCALDSVEAVVGKESFCSVSGLADLNYQAATRGRRMMDHVLEDKAKVKRGLAASSNVLLAFGGACFASAGTSGNPVVMTALGAVGGLSVALGCPTHLVGLMINATADDRYWSVLPGRLLVVPVGASALEASFADPGHSGWGIRGYSGWDEVCRGVWRGSVARPPAGVPVAHLSALSWAEAIHEYGDRKFIKPGEAAVSAVREGWDKAEITR